RSRAVLSIVVPCFNEEQRLPRTIEQIERYLDARNTPYELILVDDGSADGTRLIMDAAAERHSAVRVEGLPHNRGKGRALAVGVEAAKGDEVLITDADLSTPIEELEKLQAALRDGAGVAIGSRALRASRVEISQPVYRVLMGKAFNLIVQAVLLPGIWDTQCGFKLFRADVAHSVFAGLATDGFGFDPEVLYRARKQGVKIAEVPVVWRNSAPTKVSPVRSFSWRWMRTARTVRKTSKRSWMRRAVPAGSRWGRATCAAARSSDGRRTGCCCPGAPTCTAARCSACRCATAPRAFAATPASCCRASTSTASSRRATPSRSRWCTGRCASATRWSRCRFASRTGSQGPPKCRKERSAAPS